MKLVKPATVLQKDALARAGCAGVSSRPLRGVLINTKLAAMIPTISCTALGDTLLAMTAPMAMPIMVPGRQYQKLVLCRLRR